MYPEILQIITFTLVVDFCLSAVGEIKKKKERQRTFGLHTRLGIYITAEELKAFKEDPAPQSGPTSTYMQDATVIFYFQA